MLNHQIQKGTISILLVIFILTSVFVIAFGLSEIFLKQLKMTSRSSDSIKAYQAADSGIEYALGRVKQGAAIPASKLCDNWTSVDGAKYCLVITEEGSEPNKPEGIKAIGRVGNVRRAIEVALTSP